MYAVSSCRIVTQPDMARRWPGRVASDDEQSHDAATMAVLSRVWWSPALQVVIAIAEKYMRSADPRYPVGRTRLETVGVVACAVIMTIATIEVIQSAAMDLANGFTKGLFCPPGRALHTCPL